MNKKLTGIVAGAAGAALLLSGATYALWSDSGSADGGTISAGNLDVSVAAGAWSDVSADRTDAGHAIDLATFDIVPGDTIRGSYGFDVGLEGDNMVADLALAGGGLTGELAEGLSVVYTVVDGSGSVVASSSTASGVTVQLAGDGNTHNAALPHVSAAVDGTVDFTLQVDVTFDAATADQDLVNATAALANAGVSLTQVRIG